MRYETPKLSYRPPSRAANVSSVSAGELSDGEDDALRQEHTLQLEACRREPKDETYPGFTEVK